MLTFEIHLDPSDLELSLSRRRALKELLRALPGSREVVCLKDRSGRLYEAVGTLQKPSLLKQRPLEDVRLFYDVVPREMTPVVLAAFPEAEPVEVRMGRSTCS